MVGGQKIWSHAQAGVNLEISSSAMQSRSTAAIQQREKKAMAPWKTRTEPAIFVLNLLLVPKHWTIYTLLTWLNQNNLGVWRGASGFLHISGPWVGRPSQQKQTSKKTITQKHPKKSAKSKKTPPKSPKSWYIWRQLPRFGFRSVACHSCRLA